MISNSWGKPIGKLDHGGIPVAMASKAFRRPNEGVHLGGSEIFPGSPIGVGPLARWEDAGCGWVWVWDGRSPTTTLLQTCFLTQRFMDV